MSTPILLCVIGILGTLGFGLVCLLFRFGFRDNIFFAAVLLPNVWLSRLDVNAFHPYNLEFPTFWGLLVLLIMLSLLGAGRNTLRLLWTPSKRLGISMALLVMVMALSTLTQASEPGDILRGFQATCYGVLPFLAAWGILQCCRVDDVGISRAVTAILIVGGFAASLGVVSAVFPDLLRGVLAAYRGPTESERAFSPLGGSSAVAMCLLMVYCLAAGQLIGKRQRLLSVAVLLLCFVGLLSTLARAALVAFLVANLYLYGRHFRGLPRRLVVLAITGIVVLLPAGYVLSRVYSLERFGEDWFQGRGDSVRLRLESAETAFVYGVHNLPLGGGWGLVYYPAREVGDKQARERMLTFEEGHSASKPHSLFALVFAEAGIFAFIFLLLFLWQIWRNMKPPDIRLDQYGHSIVHGFRAGYVSFLVLSIAQDHLFFATKISLFFYLFVFMGVAASTYYRVATLPYERPSPEVKGAAAARHPLTAARETAR